MDMSYPVLLHLKGRRVVVVGGGQVAARKIADLLATGAEVAVISPTLSETLCALAGKGQIRWYEEYFTADKLRELKPLLVFAATNSTAVNAQIIAQSHDFGLLVGTVDDVPGGDLTSMAALRRGRITLAIATDAASPALAAHLRERLETVVGEEYEILADWLAELRAYVREQLSSAHSRRTLWRAILNSPVLEHLRNGDEASARAEMNRLLAEVGVQVMVR
jgi:precorrin-2 dehydrogenase/sirohydrochlorin ferrochelatase